VIDYNNARRKPEIKLLTMLVYSHSTQLWLLTY